MEPIIININYFVMLLLLLMRVTPPLLVRSIQGGFRPYAVRNNSVKSYAALKNSHFFNRFP